MRIRIVLMPDGQIGLFSEQGTLADGERDLTRLLNELGATGIQFSQIGDVEQHRHDDTPTHQHIQEGAERHDH